MVWGLSIRWSSALWASAALLLALVFAPSAAAATTKTGYDISWPQCGNPYPGKRAFGLVGVNGGLANDANPCLSSELAWAKASPGLTTPPQPAASLYINTANPGPGVPDWPKSGGAGSLGNCHGGWSRACAYIYGQRRATYSYGLVSAIDQNLASTAPWWLDIETSNSWATSSTAGYARLNVAAIQGFMAGLTSNGAPSPVGVYSSGAQWRAITGLSPEATESAFGGSPRSWVAGAITLKQARKICASRAFMGVRPRLAQYSAKGFDADLRCG